MTRAAPAPARCQPVAVLLAFHHEHRRPRSDGLAQFRQAIEHRRAGTGFIDPLAGGVLMADAKVLGGVADLLANLDPGGVAVAIGRYEFPPARWRFRGQTEGGHDALVAAAGEAVQQQPAVHLDRQGGIAVLMAGATGFVAVAGFDRAVAGHPLQSSQSFLKHAHDRPRKIAG